MEDPQQDSLEGDAGEEIVEGVVVVAATRRLEPVRESPPLRQVAAVAATGFVAGAATAAVLGRRLSRTQARRAALSPAPAAPVALRRGSYDIVASRRYVVDVHTIAPR
ncbi:MAG TPA: hypothetical protein VGG41_02020 [Solirubrobacteraceae bacterium]